MECFLQSLWAVLGYAYELLTCLLVGGLLVVLRVVLCERRCPLVFYGVFGGKEIIGVLRTMRRHWRSLRLFSSMLFIFGQLQLYLLWSLVFIIFFALFSSC
jgi:hypothetical protein